MRFKRDDSQDCGLDFLVDVLDASPNIWRQQEDGSFRRPTIYDYLVAPDSLEERFTTAALAISCSVFVVVFSVLIWTFTLVNIFKTS